MEIELDNMDFTQLNGEEYTTIIEFVKSIVTLFMITVKPLTDKAELELFNNKIEAVEDNLHNLTGKIQEGGGFWKGMAYGAFWSNIIGFSIAAAIGVSCSACLLVAILGGMALLAVAIVVGDTEAHRKRIKKQRQEEDIGQIRRKLNNEKAQRIEAQKKLKALQDRRWPTNNGGNISRKRRRYKKKKTKITKKNNKDRKTTRKYKRRKRVVTRKRRR